MIDKLIHLFVSQPAKILNRLQDVFMLGMRLFVGWQFFKAGLLKLQAWDSTLFLFQYEYRVPLLSPNLAAILGTVGELLFPALLFVGLAGRVSALGLQAVNIMAVVAYAHVIFSEGFESSAADHYLWGLMLLAIMIYGPGKLSADYILGRLRGTPADF
jgi:putative oxidoreductase